MKPILKYSLAAIVAAQMNTLVITPALAQEPPHKMELFTDTHGPDPFEPGQKKSDFIFRAVPSDPMRQPDKEMPWMGVGIQETDEPLSAQLGLKTGEGLIVNYVATNSPAAEAGIQKNDVLVNLEGQMLVDPIQFRKLIQMHGEGDKVKLEYYRAGKRTSANVKLALHKFDGMGIDGEYRPFGGGKPFLFQSKLPDLPEFDTAKLTTQLQQAKDQAGKAMIEAKLALEEAMKQSLNGTDGLNQKLQLLQQKLGNLANGGASIHNDATVVVKNDGGAVRTIVKKDDSGTYIVVADPAKRLTAHDPNGKLLFDGSIDSVEQQQKVAPEIWKKVQPMLEQLDSNFTNTRGGGGGGGGEVRPDEQ